MAGKNAGGKRQQDKRTERRARLRRLREGRECFLCLLACLVASLLLAVSPVRAELRFESTRLDLGEVRTGLPLEPKFRFVSTGTRPVEIRAVRPGCGCLAPELRQTVYLPGEKGELPLRVKTLGERAGPHSWRMHVTWRCGEVEKEIALEVQATVVTEVNVEPGALTLNCTGPLRHEIRLTDQRARPLHLRAVHSSAAFLKAQAQPTQRTAAGRWLTIINLEATATCPVGRHEEKLVLYTDDPVYGQLEVPVTVVRRAARRLQVTPANLEWTGKQGQPLPARLLEVADARKEPVLLGKVTADHPALRCTWATGPEHCSTIRVQVDHTQLAGKGFVGQLRIEVDQPVRETLLVPVRVQVE